MGTVEYVVRDASGSVRSGTFPEGDPTTVYVSSSRDVSLNLSAGDVIEYQRQGNDLLVTQADGTIMVLDGYFDEAATGPKNLFLSEQGELVEVFLGDTDPGILTASYAPLDIGGKWSAYDELVFLDLGRVEPVVAPLAAGPLLGGLGGVGSLGGVAAAGGAALAVGGLGGGGGGDDGDNGGGGNTPTVIQPTVNDPATTQLIGGTTGSTPTISGTGAPGSTVIVNVGTKSETVTVDTNGVWEATFDPADLPADGIHNATVNVVDLDGNTFDLTGPEVDIDTTAPVAVVTAGAVSSGDYVNEASHANGATISGTGEVGATIDVKIDGTTHSTTVDADGNWSVTFANAEIQGGEYTSSMTITSTDARGNSVTISDSLQVDTVAPNSAIMDVETDNIVNFAEAADGVTLSGAGEAGSTVSIEFQGITRSVDVDANGAWSMDFASSEIAGGTYDSTITVTSTDGFGNSSSFDHTIRIDTEQNLTLDASVGGDFVINGTEQSGGVTFTGTAEAGSIVDVTMGTVTHQVTAGPTGAWSANFAAGEIQTGTYSTTVTAVATDGAGNTETTSASVNVDTETAVAVDPGQAGGDNIINQAEAASAVTLTGTAEAGSTVEVTVAGISRPATVAANGSWTAVFGAGTIPAGEYDTTVTATSTDAAGNTATSSASIRVDTVAGEVALSQLPIEIDDVINAVERSDGVEISGTATPGLTVTVELGDAMQTVVAGTNGGWSILVPASQIPTGTSSLPIKASITDAAGNSKSVSDSVNLDTQVDNFTQTTTTIEGDDIINAAERSDGVQLNGTVEPGSTVSVQMGNVTLPATVDGQGNWSVNFPASSIPTGTYDAEILVTAIDAAGNRDEIRDSVKVDTESALNVNENQTADDTINTVEHAQGVTLSGTSEPGSSVTVELANVTRAATVSSTGAWTATFSAAELPEGTYTASASITATDPAGNSTSVTETFQVDTDIDTPDVDSVTFVRSDVGRIGTQDSVDSYSVSSLDPNGGVSTPGSSVSTHPVFGTEFTFNTPIADGTNLVVNRTDDAGNTASTLVVLEDGATSIDHAGLSNFDVAALNLDYGDGTNLVLTETQIKAMSGATDELTVHGGTDDTLQVAGAVDTGQTRTIDNQTYNVYTIGNDGATLVIEQDVNVII